MNTRVAVYNQAAAAKIQRAGKRFSQAQVLLLTSIFVACVFNFPFLKAVFTALSPDTLWDWLFMLSVPVLLTALLVIFFSIFGALFFTRTVLAINIVVSSLLCYGTLVYGVLFDKGMIQNVIETDSGEAFSYLNASFIVFFAGLGLFPVFALLSQKVKGAFTTNLKGLLKLNLLAVLTVALIAGLFYKDYASVGRNHRSLTKYITPLAFYDSGYKYLRDTYMYPPLPFRVLDNHPTVAAPFADLPSTLVVVVGETARADKFSLNGYSRQTNPELDSMNVVSFQDVSSCGTATAVSVPCMFSRQNRESYDKRVASSQDNVLDLIQRAGYQVQWIDNNSSCKGVCKRIEETPFDPKRDPSYCDGDFCYDAILLKQLSEALAKQSTDSKNVIVLHTIGSHGPTYYRRYPREFAQFSPDCPRSDIQNCDNQQLINTYDNTILYTDHILAGVIREIAHLPNAAMLYISDHGESLGEKGLYLHGFPYNLAPKEQTRVPMVYWSSSLNDPHYRDCINKKASAPVSQDNLFDSLLGLAHIESKVYQPEMDVFSSCNTQTL